MNSPWKLALPILVISSSWATTARASTSDPKPDVPMETTPRAPEGAVAGRPLEPGDSAGAFVPSADTIANPADGDPNGTRKPGGSDSRSRDNRRMVDAERQQIQAEIRVTQGRLADLFRRLGQFGGPDPNFLGQFPNGAGGPQPLMPGMFPNGFTINGLFGGPPSLGEIGHHPITLHADVADPLDVMIQVLQKANVSYVMEGDLKQPSSRKPISVNFNNVPVEEALAALSDASGLGYHLRGTVLVLAPRAFERISTVMTGQGPLPMVQFRRGPGGSALGEPFYVPSLRVRPQSLQRSPVPDGGQAPRASDFPGADPTSPEIVRETIRIRNRAVGERFLRRDTPPSDAPSQPGSIPAQVRPRGAVDGLPGIRQLRVSKDGRRIEIEGSREAVEGMKARILDMDRGESDHADDGGLPPFRTF